MLARKMWTSKIQLPISFCDSKARYMPAMSVTRNPDFSPTPSHEQYSGRTHLPQTTIPLLLEKLQ